MTEILPATVDLWLSPEPDLLAADKARFYESLLSAAEKVRWQRFLHTADRDRFLHARALTRTVLSSYVGDVAPEQLSFSQGSWGKPTLAPSTERQPLFFNLSHTRGMAVLAVTRAGEIGVDVESLERRVELLALSERYFAASEHRQIAQLADQAQRERFFMLWTLKEAYLKARGLGLHLGLDRFAFDCSTSAISLEESTEISSGALWSFDARKHGEFCIAVALQRGAAAEQAGMQVKLRQGQPGDMFAGV